MNMLRKHPRIFWTICALQLLVLLGMGVSAVSQARHPQTIVSDLEEWVSDFGSYEDEWYIDEELFDFDEEIDFLHGPYAETPKGTYTLKIAYDADFDQKFYVYSESGGESALRVGEDVNLYAKKNQVEFRFTVLKDVDDLEVVFLYDGQGAFHVNEYANYKSAGYHAGDGDICGAFPCAGRFADLPDDQGKIRCAAGIGRNHLPCVLAAVGERACART